MQAGTRRSPRHPTEGRTLFPSGTNGGRSPGAWTFTPGRWPHLEQEVIVNHLGALDGVVRVWVDGKLVVNRSDMLYRVSDNVLVAGLMFSTFLGGHDPSWASPRTQSAFFRNFEFFGRAETQ